MMYVEPFASMPATPRIVLHPSSRAQGSLFAATALPRQLPTYKYGPEDEAHETRH